MKAGAASRVINPEIGAFIQGASVDRRGERIRDDLEANALYLADDSARNAAGATADADADDLARSVLLVSCDLVGLESPFVATFRDAIADATGIPPRSVIIACTHTHSGPSLIRTNYLKPLDTAYIDRLRDWLVELATEAVGSARPAELAWGRGDVRIGWNRRCCWADGSHSMHGDTARADFTGLEGPDDTQHLAVFVREPGGRLIAVLHHNTSHPTSFYGADFFSADFPGAARAFLRDLLGPVPVLYLNGAFGDIGNNCQLAPEPNGEPRERRMLRAAHLAAGETLRLLHEAHFTDDLPLGHAYEDLAVAVRLPEPDRLAWAREKLAATDAGDLGNPVERYTAYGIALLTDEFGADPADSVPVHAVRIGDVGLATNPCELFCQFGLDIKRRSPAAATAVCSIADGYGGYCPIAYGVLGGGYSGAPLHWTRLELLAGYKIVDAASKLLHGLWPKKGARHLL
jgi:hypothetical protein